MHTGTNFSLTGRELRLPNGVKLDRGTRAPIRSLLMWFCADLCVHADFLLRLRDSRGLQWIEWGPPDPGVQAAFTHFLRSCLWLLESLQRSPVDEEERWRETSLCCSDMRFVLHDCQKLRELSKETRCSEQSHFLLFYFFVLGIICLFFLCNGASVVVMQSTAVFYCTASAPYSGF